jgi:hypothetical protein
MRDKRYTRIDLAAQEIFAKRHIVSLDGKIWADAPVDAALLRTVGAHWPAFVRKMEEGDLMLCPTHEAHKPFWQFVDGRWLCLACRRLHKAVC